MTGLPLATGTGACVTCPRCGGAFHCGARDPAPCACTGLQLSGETLAALRQQFDGCLCMACLTNIANIALSASPGAASAFDPTEGLPTTDQASGQPDCA